jgi:L-ascorbate metabolism protein UlaG (beta-lactamase superfamily)
LIGHTHFDHVLDAPEIARQHGCKVYGSRSVATLLRLYGLESQAEVVDPYRVYSLGPFEVTFVPSVHSKLALGLFVPNSGPITCDHLDGLHVQAYNCDQVWGIHIAVAGVSFYHQGSADLVDDAVRHRGVDYFLCGIAGRQFSPRYVDRVLRRLTPRVIVPSHYDNFFAPFSAPMDFTVGVDVARFSEEVAAVSKEFEIRSLELGQSVGV